MSPSLLKSESKFRFSGEIPSNGDISPPNTWYLPLNDDFSIKNISVGSFTTHNISSFLYASLQIWHNSPSIKQLHIEHDSMVSFKFFRDFEKSNT